MTTFYYGKISALVGSWGSGIATLVFQDGKTIACENGETVRSLDTAFKNVIDEGHTINQKAIRDQEIIYFYDDFGLCLGGFIKYGDWLAAGYPTPGDNGITLDESGKPVEVNEDATV